MKKLCLVCCLISSSFGFAADLKSLGVEEISNEFIEFYKKEILPWNVSDDASFFEKLEALEKNRTDFKPNPKAPVEERMNVYFKKLCGYKVFADSGGTVIERLVRQFELNFWGFSPDSSLDFHHRIMMLEAAAFGIPSKQGATLDTIARLYPMGLGRCSTSSNPKPIFKN